VAYSLKLSHVYFDLVNSHRSSGKTFLVENILPEFSQYYKNVIFGCFSVCGKDSGALFLVNLILFVAKFHIQCKFSKKKKFCAKN